MATLSMKELNELERLVIECFRLELKECDLSDELTSNAKIQELNEKLRKFCRYRVEIWIELIPLIRQQRRNERLSGKTKMEAQAKLKFEIDKLNEKWEKRVPITDGRILGGSPGRNSSR